MRNCLINLRLSLTTFTTFKALRLSQLLGTQLSGLSRLLRLSGQFWSFREGTRKKDAFFAQVFCSKCSNWQNMVKTQVKSPAAHIVKCARMPYKAHKRDIMRFVVWVYT